MAAMPPDVEEELRLGAIAYVTRVCDANGGVITRKQLESFVFRGEQVKLIDTGRGIRNPAQLSATLTILTNPAASYEDGVGEDGYPRYSIRNGEWAQGDNRNLHEAYERGSHLIWLQTVRFGVFTATAPVYLVEAHPEAREYTVALTTEMRIAAESGTHLEKRYAVRQTKQRLHQPMFRAMVLGAYQQRCAVCNLGHVQLLEASHITPDSDDLGLPVVSNGLSLCKIHHSAYDINVMGIRPDLRVEIATALLEEVDGPMLKHGLQEFHGRTLMALPRRRKERPSPERLEERYERFRLAG